MYKRQTLHLCPFHGHPQDVFLRVGNIDFLTIGDISLTFDNYLHIGGQTADDFDVFTAFNACFHRNFLGDVVFYYINIYFTVFCDDCISGQYHGVAGRIGDEAHFSQHAGLQKTAAVVQCDFYGVCT